MSVPTFSMIVPTLNEGPHIREHIQYHLDQFDFGEVVVVDGGSRDRTLDEVRGLDPRLTLIRSSPPGRGKQLREGVRVSRGEWLILLHADTRLPASFTLDQIDRGPHRWGWFDCRLDATGWQFSMVSRAISWRSALFSSPTGDQALFMHRSLLERAGGIPDQPLMEDVELVRKLRSLESGRRVTSPVLTSARRWKRDGVFRTILRMWITKLFYYIGVPPGVLERWYYGGR